MYQHPIARFSRPQMGFDFNKILDSIVSSAEAGVQKAGQQAIASTLKQVASDPVVQDAMMETGNDAAIQSLAAQLKAAQKKTISVVTQNPMTTALLLGGFAVSAIALFWFVSKK